MLVKKALYFTFAGFLLGLMSYAHAGQFEVEVDKDNVYVIHYNALSTEILLPEVARRYGVVRSKNRAMLNVSVRKGGKNNLMQTQAVLAKVTAQAVNLNGQLKELEMRQVEEGDAKSKAIYYITVFTVTDKETLNFTLKVDPENKGQEHEIKFKQQFFVN
jgi:hypothetical protein